PDRFVIGTCPKCGAEGQYGDNCEICNSTYSPLEMNQVKCSICGNKPVARETDHLFFKLNNFKPFLESWVPEHTSKEVFNKGQEWLKGDLQDWCITRDEPYFGFEAPGHPGKYLYVWVDAPIGYISSTKEWCDRHGKNLSDYWKSEKTEIYHFIGKDITYFHILFWPAMLENAGYKTPTSVFVHGMLTVNGIKMSKSRGTFINAETYLKHLDPLYLRYYLACKISSSIGDIDLNFEDFSGRVNSDLIGKITNVASRGASMLGKMDNRIGALSEEGRSLVKSAIDKGDDIARHYEARDFSKAMIEIRSIADDANKYFDSYEPWKLIKTDPEKTREVLTTILNLFRIMAIFLKPVLPSYAVKVEKLFNEEPYLWDSANKTLENHKINAFEHLMQRLDPKKLEDIVEETRKSAEEKKAENSDNKTETDKKDFHIEYSDFEKIDLRVAQIVDAKAVEGAAKLLQLTLDIGTEKRNVFAGIKSAYDPEDLKGRLTVMVANLKPRKMKFGISEGMVLAASGEDGKGLFILSPDKGAKPGDKIS
ncbi:MAG: methionine--tRNA ligase, partial [Oligoflexales bacterium]|nr:methionine--tRNA ligase [Oligoflexales bacterium]